LTGDARFFSRHGPFDLSSIVLCAEAEADPADVRLEGVASLSDATERQVSFLDNRRYLPLLRQTRAGAVIVHPSLASFVPSSTIGIRSPDPYAAWARVCRLFHPPSQIEACRHPTAVIAATASVDPSANLGPHVVVEAGAFVGPGVRLGAGVTIHSGVIIGADTILDAGVTVSHAIIGSRVHLGPGCRIGQEGFGVAVTTNGFLAIPQLGRVLIEDDVRVGANTTIDRGSARDTVIGASTWIDNLVQIGHNVTIGRHCIIVAQAGIAGSTTIGNFVRIGGQAAISGHLIIGDHAGIAGQAGVIGSVAAATEVMGTPAQPKREFLRQIAALRKSTKARSL